MGRVSRVRLDLQGQETLRKTPHGRHEENGISEARVRLKRGLPEDHSSKSNGKPQVINDCFAMILPSLDTFCVSVFSKQCKHVSIASFMGTGIRHSADAQCNCLMKKE
jgi:hypothetical protein